MFFDFLLLIGLLLFLATLATPSEPGARLAHGSQYRRSELSGRLNQTIGPVSNIQYTSNWAGAFWSKDPKTFKSVTGTFTVPTPLGPPGSSAAAWVGIDGSSCRTAILQTGIMFTVTSREPTYKAWYEWYPAPSYDFSGIDIAAGHVVKLTVIADTDTLMSGIVTVENLTNGQTVSQNLTSPASLCSQDAEWIVEDYKLDDQQVPFANFGTITFSSAQAAGAVTYVPTSANIMDIYQNNQVLTSVETEDSSVTIKYI